MKNKEARWRGLRFFKIHLTSERSRLHSSVCYNTQCDAAYTLDSAPIAIRIQLRVIKFVRFLCKCSQLRIRFACCPLLFRSPPVWTKVRTAIILLHYDSGPFISTPRGQHFFQFIFWECPTELNDYSSPLNPRTIQWLHGHFFFITTYPIFKGFYEPNRLFLQWLSQSVSLDLDICLKISFTVWSPGIVVSKS